MFFVFSTLNVGVIIFLFPLSSPRLLFSHWWNFVSHESNSIIPCWLWESFHLHIFPYKGEPSPHFDDPQFIHNWSIIHPQFIHYYAIVMLQVWRVIFEKGVWILKIFVENFYLLVFFSHASMASIMIFHPFICILA